MGVDTGLGAASIELEPAPPSPAAGESDDRPTEALPMRQLLQVSMYWFGISVLWGGMGIVVQDRIPTMVPAGWDGPALALQSVLSMIMAAAIQPTIGAVSDYTISRWGRRKPYIAIGASLDLLFLAGVAFSNTYIAFVAFLVLLQFSSNFAQGPFQGYVPDLVPQPQVGLASALVGVMQTLGFVIGNIVITFGVVSKDYAAPLLFLGVIEVATAAGTLLWVREGRKARDRAGKSWRSIASSAWGTDILRERSFVNLVISRLLFLAGINMLLSLNVWFMERSLHMSSTDEQFWLRVASATIAVLTLLSAFPSARISDRIGRKPVIYAACAIGAVGMLVAALAPSVEIFVLGAVGMGIASGTFLAVDWALMTDIIPKAASGRYMGISNIAVVSAGPIATLVGGGLVFVAFLATGDEVAAIGPRAAFLAAVPMFALAAFFLRRVDARPRAERLHDEVVVPAIA